MNETIVLHAPAKLTLFLRIVGRRSDGFHLIEAEMITLDLHDTLTLDPQATGLEIVAGDTRAGPGSSANTSNSDIPLGDTNLVNRALALVNKHAGVVLEKRIPSQAGLGGGSADAAAILRWARFDDSQAASELGADVPFCVVGGRAKVSGIGEMVEPLEFTPMDLTLITPPIKCSTPEVFRAWDDLGGPRDERGANDLTVAALVVAPQLARWRDKLAEMSGHFPTLAGSGSTWFVPGHINDGSGFSDNCVNTKATPSGWTPERVSEQN